MSSARCWCLSWGWGKMAGCDCCGTYLESRLYKLIFDIVVALGAFKLKILEFLSFSQRGGKWKSLAFANSSLCAAANVRLAADENIWRTTLSCYVTELLYLHHSVSQPTFMSFSQHNGASWMFHSNSTSSPFKVQARPSCSWANKAGAPSEALTFQIYAISVYSQMPTS